MKMGDHFKDWTPDKQLRAERVQIIDDDNDDSYGIEAVRKKLVNDLETEAKRMWKAILEKEKKKQGKEEEVQPPSSKEAAASACRWELRSKSKIDRTVEMETKQRTMLCVVLSKSEIEEDFMKMIGYLPPRKPNKRPNIVQKQMDTVFPGLSLTNVTADLYKIPEPPVCCRSSTKTKNKKLRINRY